MVDKTFTSLVSIFNNDKKNKLPLSAVAILSVFFTCRLFLPLSKKGIVYQSRITAQHTLGKNMLLLFKTHIRKPKSYMKIKDTRNPYTHICSYPLQKKRKQNVFQSKNFKL